MRQFFAFAKIGTVLAIYLSGSRAMPVQDGLRYSSGWMPQAEISPGINPERP
jgi:hypothetical protein